MNDAEPAALLRSAIEHHKRGDVQAATMAYRQLIERAASDERAAEVLAMMASQSGRPKAARAAVESFLATHPGAARLWYILALIDIADGSPSTALGHLQKAADANPESVDIVEATGRAHLELGNVERAAAAFNAVLVKDPNHAQAHNGLGRIACSSSDWSAAQEHFMVAQRVLPAWPAPTINLAVLNIRMGRGDEAVSMLKDVLSEHPRIDSAWAVLIDALLGVGRVEAALSARAEVEALKVDSYVLRNACGRACLAGGRYDPAIRDFERATALREAPIEAFNNLGNALRVQGRHESALVAIDRAIELNPSQGEAWNSRGMVCLDIGDINEADQCFERAIQLAPLHEPAHLNYAQVPWMLGKLNEAIQRLEAAIATLPDSLPLQSRLLMAMHYSPRFAPRRIEAVARAYGERVGRAPGADSGRVFPSERPSSKTRAVRIGVVSADIRAHPVGWALRRLIPAWRRQGVDVFGYSNHPDSDALTETVEAHCTGFRSIVGRSDAEMEAVIAGDRIDVLFDLSGHTSGHRLGLFGRRVASRQYTWMGFFGTTGLSTFDGIISDGIVMPSPQSEVHTEPIIRLDRCFFAVDPRDLPAIPATPPPSIMSGRLTLGSFNNPLKYSEDVVRTWAQVLAAIPNSDLLLCYPSMDPESTAKHVRKLFVDAGVEANRVEVRCDLSREQALAEYGRVDIALDPSQVNGGMTTVEALWMGVPVLGLRGDRQSNRIGESFVQAIGFPEWMVESSHDLIDTVRALGEAIDERIHLRRDLRSRLEGSVLCDVSGLAEAVLEQVIRVRSGCVLP